MFQIFGNLDLSFGLPFMRDTDIVLILCVQYRILHKRGDVPDLLQCYIECMFCLQLIAYMIILVTTATTENAKFWPVLANFGYFVADIGTFCRTFAGLYNVVVPTLAIIRYTTVLDFFMLFMWC